MSAGIDSLNLILFPFFLHPLPFPLSFYFFPFPLSFFSAFCSICASFSSALLCNSLIFFPFPSPSLLLSLPLCLPVLKDELNFYNQSKPDFHVVQENIQLIMSVKSPDWGRAKSKTQNALWGPRCQLGWNYWLHIDELSKREEIHLVSGENSDVFFLWKGGCFF